MKHFGYSLLLSLVLLPVWPAVAYQPIEQSLEQRIADSDLIVTGTALSTPDRRVDDGKLYASVRVELTIKGKAPATIDVLTVTDFSELNPDCCQVGSKYLFFLERTDGNKYRPVNFKYGVYRLP